MKIKKVNQTEQAIKYLENMIEILESTRGRGNTKYLIKAAYCNSTVNIIVKDMNIAKFIQKEINKQDPISLTKVVSFNNSEKLLVNCTPTVIDLSALIPLNDVLGVIKRLIKDYSDLFQAFNLIREEHRELVLFKQLIEKERALKLIKKQKKAKKTGEK